MKKMNIIEDKTLREVLSENVNMTRDMKLVDLINSEGDSIKVYFTDIETFVSTLQDKFTATEVLTLDKNKVAFSKITNKEFLKLFPIVKMNFLKAQKNRKPDERKYAKIKEKLSDYWHTLS